MVSRLIFNCSLLFHHGNKTLLLFSIKITYKIQVLTQFFHGANSGYFGGSTCWYENTENGRWLTCLLRPCSKRVMNINSNATYIKSAGIRGQGASYQIRKIAGCACAGNAGNFYPRHRLQRKPLVSDPGMHHGTCVTHVPWCMSGSLTRGGGENVPGIPGACAARNFTYLCVVNACNRKPHNVVTNCKINCMHCPLTLMLSFPFHECTD